MRLGYLGNTCVVTKLRHNENKFYIVSKRCKTRNLGFKDHFLVRLISHIDFETANMYLLITHE